MAMIYVMLIIKGKKRLSSVPNLLRSQVEEILIDMGIDLEEVQ
jgi:hypothetical protein